MDLLLVPIVLSIVDRVIDSSILQENFYLLTATRWRGVRTVLSHVKFYQSICHIVSINDIIKLFKLLFVCLLIQLFITCI